MPLHEFSEKDLRDHCRRILEGLELWLRRLIHDQFCDAFGQDYIDAVDGNDENVINSNIKRRLKRRLNEEPDRYERPIDAATFGEMTVRPSRTING